MQLESMYVLSGTAVSTIILYHFHLLLNLSSLK